MTRGGVDACSSILRRYLVSRAKPSYLPLVCDHLVFQDDSSPNLPGAAKRTLCYIVLGGAVLGQVVPFDYVAKTIDQEGDLPSQGKRNTRS